jgi:NAD(P)H-nitrite reductase large subunit
MPPAGRAVRSDERSMPAIDLPATGRYRWSTDIGLDRHRSNRRRSPRDDPDRSAGDRDQSWPARSSINDRERLRCLGSRFGRDSSDRIAIHITPDAEASPMPESYVIIGDGIAGSSAAETIREEAPDAEVTVITDEGETLYNRILIKEFAKGKLPAAPISIHDEAWYEERNIALRLDTHITTVDAEAHELHTHEGETIPYDELLIATGGTPTQLPVPNADAEGIHHFWTFEDARAIKAHAEAENTGVIVGAGLLGIDLAAISAAHELDAHYLMRGECWWRYALSPEGGEIIHDALRERNVTPVFDSGVDRFEVDSAGHVTAAIDPNGDSYEGDFVGIAIGLDFNVEYLGDVGLELDDGIVVDEYMRTNVEDVYAAGDITRYYDVLLDEHAQNGSWGSAKQQGSIAGQTMVAENEGRGEEDFEEFRWVSSYSITHFDFPFLSFGHPTLGDDSAERKYSDTEWRRVAFKNGKVVGGVLIGDLAPQSKYKQLIREQRPVADQKEVLLQQEIDLDDLAPAQEQ